MDVFSVCPHTAVRQYQASLALVISIVNSSTGPFLFVGWVKSTCFLSWVSEWEVSGWERGAVFGTLAVFVLWELAQGMPSSKQVVFARRYLHLIRLETASCYSCAMHRVVAKPQFSFELLITVVGPCPYFAN